MFEFSLIGMPLSRKNFPCRRPFARVRYKTKIPLFYFCNNIHDQEYSAFGGFRRFGAARGTTGRRSPFGTAVATGERKIDWIL